MIRTQIIVLWVGFYHITAWCHNPQERENAFYLRLEVTLSSMTEHWKMLSFRRTQEQYNNNFI